MSQLTFFQNNKDFYNTIHLSGTDLTEAKEQTGVQSQRILEIYKKAIKLTPVEAWEAYCELYPAALLTSIRRSITSLTGQGLLIKTSEMRQGRYGKKNYIWKYDRSN